MIRADEMVGWLVSLKKRKVAIDIRGFSSGNKREDAEDYGE